MRKSISAKIIQGKGKIRRFLLAHFRHKYIIEQKRKRQGECRRCGVCCKLLVNCIMLTQDDEGNYICKIHNRKPSNCNLFPIDEKDLKDRDTILPDVPCGYTFFKD